MKMISICAQKNGKLKLTTIALNINEWIKGMHKNTSNSKKKGNDVDEMIRANVCFVMI